MSTRLYLDSARMGLLSGRAHLAHLDYIRLAAEEGCSLYFDGLLREGFELWPPALRAKYHHLSDWRGIGELKCALRAVVGQPAVIRKIKVVKLKAMKGRPVTLEEFERMQLKVPEVVGDDAGESWTYLLRGIWESGLRIDETMHVSWDLPNTIRPEWKRGRLPVLAIPHHMQKNATEEVIPLLPWFQALLLETPEAERSGWVFNPMSLHTRLNRRVRHDRFKAEWVAKVIGKIGKAAKVIVQAGDDARQKKPKYASSHDLRRSCAERLLDAGVPPMTIARVMRHASWETTRRHYAPGDVQKDAGILTELLGDVPRYISESQLS